MPPKRSRLAPSPPAERGRMTRSASRALAASASVTVNVESGDDSDAGVVVIDSSASEREMGNNDVEGESDFNDDSGSDDDVKITSVKKTVKPAPKKIVKPAPKKPVKPAPKKTVKAKRKKTDTTDDESADDESADDESQTQPNQPPQQGVRKVSSPAAEAFRKELEQKVAAWVNIQWKGQPMGEQTKVIIAKDKCFNDARISISAQEIRAIAGVYTQQLDADARQKDPMQLTTGAIGELARFICHQAQSKYQVLLPDTTENDRFVPNARGAFLPMHTGSHFYLIKVDLSTKTISIYDSAGPAGSYSVGTQRIHNWLKLTGEDKDQFKVQQEHCETQQDPFSCGFRVLANLQGLVGPSGKVPDYVDHWRVRSDLLQQIHAATMVGISGRDDVKAEDNM